MTFGTHEARTREIQRLDDLEARRCAAERAALEAALDEALRPVSVVYMAIVRTLAEAMGCRDADDVRALARRIRRSEALDDFARDWLTEKVVAPLERAMQEAREAVR